jgi:peptidoglycan/xylan/chitin deacetylase (PgdA/CDA1 family)
MLKKLIGAGILGGGAKVTLPQYLQTSVPVLLEDYENAVEWTLGNGGTMEENAVQFKSGLKSLKLTPALGSNNYARKTESWNLSAAQQFRLSLYMHDAAPLTSNGGVGLRFSHAASEANRYGKDFYNFHIGWNELNFIRADLSPVGSPSWDNPFLNFRSQTYAVAGQTTAVSFDKLQSVSSKAAVMLMFDDGEQSVYDVAYPYMKTHHIRGTAYVITDTIGVSTNATAAKLQEMYAAGWDIANHTSDHSNLATLSQADQQIKIGTAKAALDALGFIRSSAHVAYPGGNFNADTLLAMAAEGMLSGRPTITFRNAVLPCGNMYLIEGGAGVGISKTTTLATAKGYVDTAIARGECAVLLFHVLKESPSGTYDWATADFQALVDYIVSLKSQVTPITISDFYNLHSGSISIPAPV